VNKILSTFDDVVNQFASDIQDSKHYIKLFHAAYDINYLTCKPVSLKYAIEETDLFSRLLRPLAHLYYLDPFSPRTTHVENTALKDKLLQTELEMFTLFKYFLREFDFSHFESNERMIRTFVELFAEIEARRPQG